MNRSKRKNMLSGMVACGAAAMMMLSPLTAHAATISYDVKNPGFAGDADVPVVATYNGTRPGAMIPSTIEFEGSQGRYTVYAYAEEAEVSAIDTPVNIVPQSSFVMTKDGASDTANASVSQDKTSFGQADISAGDTAQMTVTSGNGQVSNVNVKRAAGNGTITIDGISKGTWRGTLKFTIS